MFTANRIVATALVLGAAISMCRAQPTEFIDLGSFQAPTSPPSTSEYIGDPNIIPFDDVLNNVTITIRWVRFELTAPIENDVYLDVDFRDYDPNNDTFLALFDATGNLLVTDDDGGSFPIGGGSGMSFGSTAERTPPTGIMFSGQDGNLAAGVYWLALAAGPGSAVTVGSSNWEISTTESFTLGFDQGQTYVEDAVIVGNTIPLPPPENDDCADALVVGEDVGATPAWSGSNEGATEDGNSPCDPNIPGVTTKDIWFLYVPSQTGFAQVVASGGAGGAATPLLSRYSAGCGSSVVACSGGGIFDFGGGTRLFFPVTTNVPVLLSLAVRAGYTGDMQLNIDIMPPPCNLNTPPGAFSDDEACGEFENNGCNRFPRLFTPIESGQVFTGELFTTTNSSDTDWYSFTLTQLSTVTFSFKSQLACDSAIFPAAIDPNDCINGQSIFISTADPLAPCAGRTGTVQLPPGNYYLAIAHRFRDNMTCGTGYEDYWISLDIESCDLPTITQSPSDVQTCFGGTISLTGAASSSEAITYEWQWAFNDPNDNWFTLFEGPFDDLGSSTVMSGTATDTLTMAGVDEIVTTLRYRLAATTCGTSATGQVFIGICRGDLNCDGAVNLTDLATLLTNFGTPVGAALEQGDIDGDGAVSLTDLAQLLANFGTSCG